MPMRKAIVRFCLGALVALGAAAGARAQRPGPITPPENPKIKLIPLHPETAPTRIPPALIVAQFTANEAKFKAAYAKYDFQQTIRVEELGTAGAPTGTYQVKVLSFLKANGKRYDRLLSHSSSSLEYVHLSTQDLEVLAEMPLFPLAGKQADKYDFIYQGKEKLDQVDTFIFRVKPKQIIPGEQLFSGVVWVDDQEMAIVKSYGKFVNGEPPASGALPFSVFETVRENTQGKFWFPAFIRSDDMVAVGQNQLPIRLVIRSSDFQLSHAKTNAITF